MEQQVKQLAEAFKLQKEHKRNIPCDLHYILKS